MRHAVRIATVLLLATSHSLAAAGAEPARDVRPPRGMAAVGPGIYRPAFPTSKDDRERPVTRFFLDVLPVTNGDFLAFVKANPKWRRQTAKALFVDDRYLAHWSDPDTLGPRAPEGAPVVNVSWFAARAYCASRGSRLPTEREWELAAGASESEADATADPAWKNRILSWYERPALDVLGPVGKGAANYWGIRDLHGLVWEWVEDFQATLVAEDDRSKGSPERSRFCGGTGAQAVDPGAYATFMRVAQRSALEARYTTAQLGFRCARDANGGGR